MDAQTIANWLTVIKGGGGALSVMVLFMGYVVKNEREKRKTQDGHILENKKRIADLEKNMVQGDELREMEDRIGKRIVESRDFLNQRITDLTQKNARH